MEVRGWSGGNHLHGGYRICHLIACSSFNVTTGGAPGLSGGVLVGGRDIGGWH
jgi:hypothetical protein